MAQSKPQWRTDAIPFDTTIVVKTDENVIYLGTLDYIDEHFYPDGYRPFSSKHIKGWYQIPE